MESIIVHAEKYYGKFGKAEKCEEEQSVQQNGDIGIKLKVCPTTMQ